MADQPKPQPVIKGVVVQARPGVLKSPRQPVSALEKELEAINRGERLPRKRKGKGPPGKL